jgi:hypothetical protein
MTGPPEGVTLRTRGKMTRTPNEKTATGHLTIEENENAREARLEGKWYEIRVRGQLGQDWSDWFEGLALKPLENGEMLLSGRIVDQAALIGILTRLNRLNLALISVQSPGE